jgi:hypothetical protein
MPKPFVHINFATTSGGCMADRSGEISCKQDSGAVRCGGGRSGHLDIRQPTPDRPPGKVGKGTEAAAAARRFRGQSKLHGQFRRSAHHRNWIGFPASARRHLLSRIWT